MPRPSTRRTRALTALAPALAPALALAALAPPTLVEAGVYHQPIAVGLVLAFLILSLALHEVMHGWMALQCGDTTARDLGRLSLNPLVHIDPVWTIVVPLVTFTTAGFIFGGAKPVPVDYRRLRSPLRDMALVALAGPLTNLALALLFTLLYKLAVFKGPYNPSQLLPLVLVQVASLNVILFVFNLIPVPPLDGSRVMTWLLPPSLRAGYANLERVGMLLIVGLLFFVPGFQHFLFSGVQATLAFLDRMTGGPW